ncbi:MAG: ATP synthase subunit I [Desulfobacteraceae bacterium]|nr:ATP synthase subunit I [Desulfobacteraceae bacterium]
MVAIRETQKKYCSRAMMVSIFISLGFILLGQKAIGKGLILGAVFSVVNFVLMGETLSARILKTKGKTFLISLGSIFFRYVLLAIPMVMAIKSETYNLFSVIAGLFSIQVMILIDHAVKFLPARQKQQVQPAGEK